MDKVVYADDDRTLIVREDYKDTLPYTMAGLPFICSALCLMYRKNKIQKGGW